MQDPSSLLSRVIDSLPGVDPNDPRIQSALGKDSEKKDEEEEEDKENKWALFVCTNDGRPKVVLWYHGDGGLAGWGGGGGACESCGHWVYGAMVGQALALIFFTTVCFCFIMARPDSSYK